MLGSQRALFDMPEDICWLNAAAYSPLPLTSRAAGERGIARKVRPWEMEADNAQRQFERARAAAARLVNADPSDIALIPSVSYGIATAGRVLPLPKGSRVLLLQDDHTSPVLEWMARATAAGATVEVVKQPSEGDWTAAVLGAIERAGPPLSIVSISAVHWSDGGNIDLRRVAPALRRQGAKLVVDATHAAGVMQMDVNELDPDFLVFPTYKWVLGPYGRAFLYIAKRWHDGVPLEQTSAGRRSIDSETTPYLRDTAYVTGARRFDMGERDHFITLEMAAIGMELMAGWGTEAITARLRMLTGRLADGLRNSGATVPDSAVRAPHILSLGFPAGMPPRLVERLAGQKVYVSRRLGRIRISPHVYNDADDIDRFIDVFRSAVN
ncbi:MAG TPA: aminotransferase class V-fold PLP-dependent enzyme [Acetobacteraceae bacterium]|nr:aminotransferase class V-fold PLP-dependent enzyme [Acetobacteraceae bacterium]